MKIADWKRFSAMVDLENNMRAKEALDDYNRRCKEDQKAREQWRKDHPDSFMGLHITPMFFPIGRPKTVEACLDWIAKGRPNYAKKVKVKKL